MPPRPLDRQALCLCHRYSYTPALGAWVTTGAATPHPSDPWSQARETPGGEANISEHRLPRPRGWGTGNGPLITHRRLGFPGSARSAPTYPPTWAQPQQIPVPLCAVSYTHLTLPTILLV